MKYLFDKNVIIIALGHKARNGKDYTASQIKKLRKNVIITHWAEFLYKECENPNRKYPLVKKSVIADNVFYSIFDYEDKSGRPFYIIRREEEVPNLHKLMTDRGLEEYMGMDEKDPLFLQFWGTNHRRKQNPDYWVDRTLSDAMGQIARFPKGEPIYILIPDTRFINEFKSIEGFGYYIEVVRLNEDGSQYIDPSRDPNHPSECELDFIYNEGLYTYLIERKFGDLEGLNEDARKAIDFIDELHLQNQQLNTLKSSEPTNGDFIKVGFEELHNAYMSNDDEYMEKQGYVKRT